MKVNEASPLASTAILVMGFDISISPFALGWFSFAEGRDVSVRQLLAIESLPWVSVVIYGYVQLLVLVLLVLLLAGRM